MALARQDTTATTSMVVVAVALGHTVGCACTSSQVPDHLISSTEAFATSTRAQVLFDKGMLGIDMTSQIVLALEVEVAARVQARERKVVDVDRHVGLELGASWEGLGAGGTGVGLGPRVHRRWDSHD